MRYYPLVAVIVAALVSAYIEQRWLRRRTPDFSEAHLQAPPPLSGDPVGKDRRSRR